MVNYIDQPIARSIRHDTCRIFKAFLNQRRRASSLFFTILYIDCEYKTICRATDRNKGVISSTTVEIHKRNTWLHDLTKMKGDEMAKSNLPQRAKL